MCTPYEIATLADKVTSGGNHVTFIFVLNEKRSNIFIGKVKENRPSYTTKGINRKFHTLYENNVYRTLSDRVNINSKHR